MRLEELARQSSTAARVSVSHLDPSPIGDPGHRRVTLPALVGLAAVLLVLGGGIYLASNRGSDTDDQPVAAADLEVPRLGLPALSSWEVSGAFELPAGDEAAPVVAFSYYGTPGAEDPFAAGDLIVGITVNADPAATTPERSDFTVRGFPASVTSGADTGIPGDTTVLEWTEPVGDGTAVDVVLASHSLGEAELRRVAENLTLEVRGGAPVATPADNFELTLVTTDDGVPLRFGLPGGYSRGSVVAYERVGGSDNEVLVLTTTTGNPDEALTALRWWTTSLEATQVSGDPGWVGRLSFDTGDGTQNTAAVLLWSPEPGVVATLSTSGDVPTTDLVGLAESAVPLDDELWASALDATSTPDTPDDFDIVYGSGEGTVADSSYAWALGIRDGTDLCFDMSDAQGGTGSCQPRSQLASPESGTAFTIDNAFGDRIASVLIVAASDVDTVTETSGVGTIEPVTADGLTWFVWVGPTEHQPRFDVVVDGTVTATLEAATETTGSPAVEPFDVSDNPSAGALGITEDFVTVLSNADGPLPWALGAVAGETCLVTGGDAVSAGCFADGITVVDPLDLPDGSIVTFIVTAGPEDCPIPSRYEGLSSVEGAAGSRDGSGYAVEVTDGVAEGASIVVLDNTGAETTIGLPDVGGTVPWPTDLC